MTSSVVSRSPPQDKNTEFSCTRDYSSIACGSTLRSSDRVKPRRRRESVMAVPCPGCHSSNSQLVSSGMTVPSKSDDGAGRQRTRVLPRLATPTPKYSKKSRRICRRALRPGGSGRVRPARIAHRDAFSSRHVAGRVKAGMMDREGLIGTAHDGGLCVNNNVTVTVDPVRDGTSRSPRTGRVVFLVP